MKFQYVTGFAGFDNISFLEGRDMLIKIKKAFKNPRLIILYVLGFGIFRGMPDGLFLKTKYRLKMRQPLDLEDPQTFNEKLQWLKLYNRRPEYTQMVDKYEVRKYIAKIIGEEYLIPLLGVYNSYDEIDLISLPNEFVLKPNHTSGNVYICKDKSQIDYLALEKEINQWLGREYYWVHREWPYKNIKPRIICEKYMVDESGTELKDYKFMCFNGEPKIIQVMSERRDGHYLINHFDLEWNEIDIPRKTIKTNPNVPTKPKNLGRMIEISKILSKNIPFVRIDLYETEAGIYFGEITFFPASGFMDFADSQTDYLLGSWIDLPPKEI